MKKLPKKRPSKKRPSKKRPSKKSRTSSKAAAKSTSAEHLTRRIQPMPAHVRRALRESGLLDAYKARPAYQRNDYLGWIAQAQRDETKDKRLAVMLAELKAGNRYMKMAWSPERG